MEPIDTDRLVLRRFCRSDAPDLLAYLRDPRASCFLSLKCDSLAAAEAEAVTRSRDDDHVAVRLKATGQLIGDLFAIPEGDVFSVGWHFNAAFGGRGHAHEAALALFGHLFAARGARRLYAYVEDHNRASQRLCERLGMRREGLFEDFVSFMDDCDGNPVYENTMQYAILRRRWRAGPSIGAADDA